jgi:hypothetical protein
MKDIPELNLTLEDHQKAFTEISFLLDIFAATIDNLMGGATASVGRIAGRQMAKKLPFYFAHPGLNEVLEALAAHFQGGVKISFTCNRGGADVGFGQCAIREVCKNREIQPGNVLCKLFHFYFDGVVNELCSRPVKSTIQSAGEVCQTRMEVR